MERMEVDEREGRSSSDNIVDQSYPEGGLEAWSVVAGSFCALFMVFGIVNSTAVFESYFSSHQLQDRSPGQIAWIFSLNLFIVFFCGIYSGRIFDAHGPRLLVAVGSLALVLSMLLLEFCTEYWHFMLNYAVLGGIGGAFLMTPAFACVGHFFERRRGLASGIANTSGSIGGIVIPLMLQGIFVESSFAWSTRALGLLLLGLAIPANLLLKRRLPASRARGSVFPDRAVLRNPKFLFCAAGMFLMEWGLFVPLAYISSYATSHGEQASFGYTIVALLNVGSFFGRWLPGLLADHLGRFNVIITTICLCAFSILALWLPAGASTPLVIVFAIAFGFASGSNLGLIPVCISQLCPIEEYGRYFSSLYFLTSFGTLTGIPIGGQLIVATGGSYWAVILFAGLSYIASSFCFIASRGAVVGWSPKKKF